MSKVSYLTDNIKNNLKGFYSLDCPKCEVQMVAKPSTFMRDGINLGGGFCVNCRCVFNTEIDDSNQKMIAKPIANLHTH